MNCNQSSGYQGRMPGMMMNPGAPCPPPGSQRPIPGSPCVNPGFQRSGQSTPRPIPGPQRPGQTSSYTIPEPQRPEPRPPRSDFGPPRYPVGMGYVPVQEWETPYSMEQGFRRGTIFPSLDYPFLMGRCRR